MHDAFGGGFRQFVDYAEASGTGGPAALVVKPEINALFGGGFGNRSRVFEIIF